VSKESAASGDGMTKFGRALSELNIEILCANPSQAKVASGNLFSDREQPDSMARPTAQLAKC
jgi:hypothetical protein